jgi:hypothetical protein
MYLFSSHRDMTCVAKLLRRKEIVVETALESVGWPMLGALLRATTEISLFAAEEPQDFSSWMLELDKKDLKVDCQLLKFQSLPHSPICSKPWLDTAKA